MSDPRFHTTRWSLVQRAQRDRPTPESRAALGTLCETYWYPMYAWLRRRGRSPDDAHDLVQSFVTQLLEGRGFDAQPDRGRFRAYILGALHHHVANVHRAAHAEKRFGDRAPLSIDADAAATRYARELSARPSDGNPDVWFTRRWALDVLERAFAGLAREQGERGHGDRLAALRPTLVGEGDADYATIGARLGLSVSAVKVTVFRLRARLRELIREAVADTVDSEQEIDDEVRELFEALGSG